jgi:heptosyltransferase-3
MAHDPAPINDAAPVLILTATRLGDAILTTGLIDTLLNRYPHSAFTVICGALPAPIFANLPSRCTVIPIKKRKYGLHWLDVYRLCAKTRWGLVVDLRNTPVSRLLRSNALIAHNRAPDESEHRARYFSRLIGLDTPAPLKLWLSDNANAAAAKLIPPGGKVVALAPAANWIGKTWPQERFAELAASVLDFDKTARIAVFTGKGEEHLATQLLDAIPPDRLINCVGNTDAGTALACIARCDVFIGNDSGLMHGAAALNIRTIGLFGPTSEIAYGPFGPNASTLRGKPRVEIVQGVGDFKYVRDCLMHDLSVTDVRDHVLAALASDARQLKETA